MAASSRKRSSSVADALRVAAIECRDWAAQVPAGMFRNPGDVQGLLSCGRRFSSPQHSSACAWARDGVLLCPVLSCIGEQEVERLARSPAMLRTRLCKCYCVCAAVAAPLSVGPELAGEVPAATATWLREACSHQNRSQVKPQRGKPCRSLREETVGGSLQGPGSAFSPRS